MRLPLLVLALAGCPGPRPTAGGDRGAATAVVIYRDGDDRVRGQVETAYRADGNAVSLAPREVGEPMAVVTSRREVELRAGAQTLALPEVPATAAPGSIWLRAIAGPGRVEVGPIHRPPSPAGVTGLRGRAVVAVVGDRRIEGTLVDLDERGALIDRDGILIAVGQARLELVDPDLDPGQPVAAELDAERPGRHRIEVAYRTAGLDWDLDFELAVSISGLTGPAEVTATPVLSIASRGVAVRGASIALFEGSLGPDGERPRPVWSGTGDIVPGVSVRRLESRAVDGAVEYRYRGFVGDRDSGKDQLRWGTASTELVELVLRLPPGSLPPAPAIARIAIASGGLPRRHETRVVPAADGEPIELVLGTSETLRGRRRQLTVAVTDGGRVVTERYELAITNRGAEAVSVRIREPLSRSDDAELVEGPEGAAIAGGAVEYLMTVAANSREAIELLIRYRLRR